MNVNRHWLDWNAPCLAAAAQWLIEQRRASDSERLCALDHLVCVLPGRRAGRLLLEYLLRECEARGLHLVPPRTITPGVIVDVLFAEPLRTPPAAPPDESAFAWAAALRQSPPDIIGKLLAKTPADDDVLAWNELARTIQRLHQELSGQRLTFDDVAETAERMELLGESERWRALQSVHSRYSDVLAQAGLACRHAIIGGELPIAETVTPETRIALIGIVELNTVQRDAVQRLAGNGVNVTALIHAPQSLQDRFDSLGCVVPEAWAEAAIELDEQRIAVADRPDDQAQEAVRFIADLHDRYATDEVTIGLGDAALSEPMQHAGAWAGLAVHGADGVAAARTLPYRLLEVAAHWLDGNRFADFASLLRHPDIERWLQRCLASDNDEVNQAIGDWIGLLDRYFSEHLHQRLDGAWLGKPEQRKRLRSIYQQVQRLLQPLVGSATRPLGEWSEPILAVLREVYGHRERLTYHTREACDALRDVAANHSAIHPQLQPTTDAATALRLTLRSAAEAMIAEPSRDDEIEMLGWLELHLDPAPALVVLGVNDGNVPRAAVADMFLPDSLRSALGLMNNARRYARDAYLLQATINSREELLLVAGRRATDGEPLAPSRLLLACEAERLPGRVSQLCEEKHARRWPTPVGAPSPRELCQFIQMPPPPSEPPMLERMSVTSFRNYLTCPYRFWLGYIEKLEAIGDAADELDPMNFGSLAHGALERFGRDESIRESADATKIAAFLHAQLDEIAAASFGKRPAPALRVQLERLKRRLDAFAQRQAELRTEGWVITQSEFRLPEQTYLDVPGQEPMRITGIIDRIDQHAETGAFRLIDYKTTESGATPFEAHHGTKKYKEDCWLDLQLPLYRFLAAQHDFPNAEVGYIVLPKDPGGVAYAPGLWTSEQFESAIDKAREVVMKVRAGEFDPNPDFRSTDYDDFATICRISVLGGDDDDGEDDS